MYIFLCACVFDNAYPSEHGVLLINANPHKDSFYQLVQIEFISKIFCLNPNIIIF